MSDYACPTDVPDRFGPIARFYDAVECGFVFFKRNPRAAVANRVPAAAKRILDVGTGTGAVLATLVRTHCDTKIVGLDASPRMLAVAERKLARLKARGIPCAETTLVCASAAQLPFEDASFDTVTGSLFFHELEPSVRARALDEAVRVLAPGGTIIVLDLDRRPAGWKWPLQWMLERGEEKWAWEVSGDGLKRELEARGIKDLSVDRGMSFLQLAVGVKPAS